MFMKFRVPDEDSEEESVERNILSEEDYEDEEEPQAFLKESAAGSYIEIEDRSDVKPWDPFENFFSWI